jgi:hypothetical protein
MADTLTVVDRGRVLEFTFADLMRYHGPGSPGGVAHAFKVLERAFPLLEPDGPPERRDVHIRTAFAGPGARDAFEAVTRAVTENRYAVDPDLARPELGLARERFVFAVSARDRAVTLVLREGLVTDEFILLARKPDRTADEESWLTALKLDLADRVMARPAAEVYDVV